MPTLSRWCATALAVLALAACDGERARVDALPDPRDGRSGLQLSGSYAGRQVAVSDGLPRLLGECEARFGMATAVCFSSRTVDGDTLVVGIGNPAAVAGAGSMEIARHGCRSAEECGAVEDVAVVEVRLGQERSRVTGGTVSLREHVPGERYAGELRLRVAGGRLSGTFDVVPRPDEGA